MKRSVVVGVLAGAMVLAGCSSGPSNESFDPRTGNYRTASDDTLAAAWGIRLNGAAEARAELIRRKAFTPEEVNAIDNNQLRIGMKDLAVTAVYPTTAMRNYLFDKDKDGNLVGRHYVLNCQGGNIPNCPYPWTTIDVTGGKVTGIRQSAQAEIPRT